MFTAQFIFVIKRSSADVFRIFMLAAATPTSGEGVLRWDTSFTLLINRNTGQTSCRPHIVLFLRLKYIKLLILASKRSEVHLDLSVFLLYACDNTVQGREMVYFQGNVIVVHITKLTVFSLETSLLWIALSLWKKKHTFVFILRGRCAWCHASLAL